LPLVFFIKKINLSIKVERREYGSGNYRKGSNRKCKGNGRDNGKGCKGMKNNKAVIILMLPLNVVFLFVINEY